MASTLPRTAPGSRGGRLWRRLTRDSELFQHADFLRLWTGQTVSVIGSQVSVVALPLVAIYQLHATASVMGLIGAVGRLPFVLYLVAGVWVDRVRRRPVMLTTDLARGLLLLGIPVAALMHALSLWLLCVILFLVMLLSVWFDTAYMSYLPSLVDRRLLLRGNSVMEGTRSGARAAGPSLAGVLVQLLGAPAAIAADAVSYFVSAFSLSRIRHPEPLASDSGGRGGRGVIADMRQGLAAITKDRVLGPLALAIGVSNLVWAAELALYLLYLARGLHLAAWLIGLILATAGPGALAGSLLAGKVQRRIGVGGAIWSGLAVFASSALIIPLAPARPVWLAAALQMASGFGMAAGGQVCAVNVMTLRQLLTPDRLLGRVNASFRLVGLGVSPAGALVGGGLGAVLGLRAALLTTIAGMFIAPLIVLLSPAGRIRSLPGQRPDADQAAG